MEEKSVNSVAVVGMMDHSVQLQVLVDKDEDEDAPSHSQVNIPHFYPFLALHIHTYMNI